MEPAPPRFNAAAQALAVAPVVITSSIRSMLFPASGERPFRANAPATLRRRPALASPACVAVARLRRSAFQTGIPLRFAT